MGNKQAKKEEPQKTQEEIMRERWLKLAENSKVDNSKTVNEEHPKTEKKSEILTDKKKIEKEPGNSNIVVNSSNEPEIIKKESSEIKIIPVTTKIETKLETSVERDPEVKILKEESKKIDKEHSIIEKVFRISLTPSDKFTHLSLYQAELLSVNKEEAFRLNELDNIMMAILNDREKRENIIVYLLETYHRAFEMIERRYRNEFDDKYNQIRKITASYLALIIYSPENFDLSIIRNDTVRELTKYYSETDEEEIDFLISDIVNSTIDDYSFMQQVFSYILNIIHLDNLTSKNNFFNCDRIKKNLNILTKVLNDNKLTRLAFVQEANFLPKGINGKSFQTGTYLGLYFNLVSFEADPNTIRISFPSLHQTESDSQVRTYSNKLNTLMTEVYNLIYLLLEYENSGEVTLQWIYDLINSNMERTKMFANTFTTSTIGFLMNVMLVLLKNFFDFESGLEKKSSVNSYNHPHKKIVLEIIEKIDIMYSITSANVNFRKFDIINPSQIGNTLEGYQNNNKIDSFNLTTKLFFLIHSIMSYFIKNLDEEYEKIAKQLSEMYHMNQINDPRFRELFSLLKSVDVYFRNTEFIKNLVRFNEISCILIITLSNKKYSYNKIKEFLPEFEFENFITDFYQNLDISNIFNLSLLPLFIIKNIISSSLVLRKYCSEGLLNDMESTKIIVYFAIIYSSQVDLIQNPHLRSEIFDILLYFFMSNPNERNAKQNIALLKLLNDTFIKDNLIFSLMRVFIDAERLGTSNQFYEKFTIRNKILVLIESIMKSHKSIYSEKILEYASTYKFEATKMITLLMNDLTYLIDECIQRLTDIKRYQELKNDAERYAALDLESRQLEDNKFLENDRLVKTELKLLNSSLSFMVVICEFCQDNFMNLRLAERLANLLNYSLDVFISKKNLKLKIDRMNEYGFDPKFILKSLITIYVYFKSYKEFLEFIVLDERSYKIDNFERVIGLKENEKISLEYDTFIEYKSLVKDLVIIEKEIKSKQINYDDADEAFIDPISAVLMEDPVKLPSSNMIVDRTTIETHLLSDPTDPFNRSKLSKEDLIPCTELKEKILAYKQSKLTNVNINN